MIFSTFSSPRWPLLARYVALLSHGGFYILMHLTHVALCDICVLSVICAVLATLCVCSKRLILARFYVAS